LCDQPEPSSCARFRGPRRIRPFPPRS